jgi:hypothetical protein
MCRYPRNARSRLEHQPVNYAQCDCPSDRNRPYRKDRAPVLLRGLASQHLKLRGALDLPIPGRPGVNLSCHGSDEQMFCAKQQVLSRGQGDQEVDLPMNGGYQG